MDGNVFVILDTEITKTFVMRDMRENSPPRFKT